MLVGLLLQGGGVDRVRAGLPYVVGYLTGSAFFLIALGIHSKGRWGR